MKWLLTIAYRSRPGNMEWQYKTVVASKPPESWLADRLDNVEIGDLPRFEVNVLYARQIDDDAAERLASRVRNQDP